MSALELFVILSASGTMVAAIVMAAMTARWRVRSVIATALLLLVAALCGAVVKNVIDLHEARAEGR